MQTTKTRISILSFAVFCLVVALNGCANMEAPKSPAGPAVASNDSGKIPVTIASEEARKEFLQGRDLSEKLLIQDSIQHFDKAIALDPG